MANQHAAQRWYQRLGESCLHLILDPFFCLVGFAPASDTPAGHLAVEG